MITADGTDGIASIHIAIGIPILIAIMIHSLVADMVIIFGLVQPFVLQVGILVQVILEIPTGVIHITERINQSTTMEITATTMYSMAPGIMVRLIQVIMGLLDLHQEYFPIPMAIKIPV